MIQKTKDALSNLLPVSTKLILNDPAKFVESIIDMIENDLGITSQLDKFLYDYHESGSYIRAARSVLCLSG